jgi:hypothetical protein
MTIRLRDLSQGALLHVVVALLAGPMKADQIARKTGKSPETIQRALAALDQEFHLITAVPDGRWPVWSLRDTSQLALDFPNGLKAVDDPAGSSPGEPANIGVNGSGGSFGKNQAESVKPLRLPPTPQISESTSGDLLISQLTRLGATPDQAARAISAAFKRRESTATISQRIAHLAEYAAAHRTIRNAGQWALRYIATGCDLPVDVHTAGPDYSGYRPYLATGDDEEEKG